ncbi:MAG: hypothetical protein P8I99_02365 [Acidimicrobiales bacterium]|nr:hypothetical protein [Acidimicrobiales bacterium]MDG1876240.1 hypothetical protein [Acidimicrobiales bacterium]
MSGMSLVAGELASTALVADEPVWVRRFCDDTRHGLKDHDLDVSRALLGGIAQGLAGKVWRDNG